MTQTGQPLVLELDPEEMLLYGVDQACRTAAMRGVLTDPDPDPTDPETHEGDPE